MRIHHAQSMVSFTRDSLLKYIQMETTTTPLRKPNEPSPLLPLILSNNISCITMYALTHAHITPAPVSPIWRLKASRKLPFGRWRCGDERFLSSLPVSIFAVRSPYVSFLTTPPPAANCRRNNIQFYRRRTEYWSIDLCAGSSGTPLLTMLI